MIYILDANNIMYKMPELRRLELDRAQDAFLHQLNQITVGKKDKIIAVFDGCQGNESSFGRVKFIFSDAGENADSVIKRLSESYGRRDVTIVSSDNEVVNYVRRGGQKAISAEEFIHHFLTKNEYELETERLKSLQKRENDYWLKLFQQKGGQSNEKQHNS
jgi:predicted RNA-binding protein with PIN domain